MSILSDTFFFSQVATRPRKALLGKVDYIKRNRAKTDLISKQGNAANRCLSKPNQFNYEKKIKKNKNNS